MKAIVTDAAAIAALKPVNIIGYLRARGWQKFSEREGRFSIWLNPTYPDAEVLVPQNREASDFVARVCYVLSGGCGLKEPDGSDSQTLSV